jgi:predicted nucleic acid-binding protein
VRCGHGGLLALTRRSAHNPRRSRPVLSTMLFRVPVGEVGVVDTSVIIAVIANEPKKDRLIKLTQGANLIAPHSVHWEIGNAFSAMLKRNRVTLEQALKAIQAYSKISIRFVDVELERSLEIAETYAYDAYLIRCALRYRSPLISLDGNLVDSAKRMQVKVVEVK